MVVSSMNISQLLDYEKQDMGMEWHFYFPGAPFLLFYYYNTPKIAVEIKLLVSIT